MEQLCFTGAKIILRSDPESGLYITEMVVR